MHAAAVERFVDKPVPSDSDERAAPYWSSCGEDGEDGLPVVPVDGGGAGGEEVLAIEGDGHLWGSTQGTQKALRGHSEGTQRSLRDGNGHLNLRRATYAHEIEIWSDEIEIWSDAAYKRARAAPTPARNAFTASAASAAAAVGTAATFSARDR